VISSVPRAVHRLATLLWCLVMVFALGVGSTAAAQEQLVAQVDDALSAEDEEAPVLGPPPSSGEVGEDAESETASGGDDSAVRGDAGWDPQGSWELVAAVRAERFALRGSQSFERCEHNRGPPA
jgi:hypothetical protein